MSAHHPHIHIPPSHQYTHLTSSHQHTTLTSACHPHISIPPSHQHATLTSAYHPHISIPPSHQHTTLTSAYHPHISILHSHPTHRHLMLNATVLSFCVLSYCDQVDMVIACLVAFNRPTRSHIGIKAKHSAIQMTNYIMMYIRWIEPLPAQG